MKFYHNKIELEVPENIYYPKEDSLLMAKILENIGLDSKKILEVGCGSGLLSILMAKCGADVTSVDTDDGAVEITKTNAKSNGVAISVLESDLFSKIDGMFDIIIFNPPYLPVEEGETDKTYAGGKNGRETIEKFVSKVKDRLKPDGFVLLLISSLTGEKEVIELFEKQKMKTSIIAREKIPWEELIVIQAALYE